MQIEPHQLLRVDDFDNFIEVRSVPAIQIEKAHLDVVRSLDERAELEPYMRAILHDPNETPHGPAELVDILTHRLTVQEVSGMAAFIIKGRSFPTVRPKDVSHQIYRLEKIADLKIAVLAAPGIILDMAKEQFCATAVRLQCRYAILDAIDLSRLLIAYGFICPRDAKRIVSGRCSCGYSPRKRLLNLFQQDALAALERSHSRGEPAGLIILPPGSGKTRIAAEDAFRSNVKNLLYLAHTDEILDVAQSEFEAKFSVESVKRHATVNSLSHPNIINIATIQLVSRNRDRLRLAEFDYIVVDEFHHVAAQSYREVLRKSSPGFLLGLTATPFRGDRQDIYELCNQNVLSSFELRAGIDAGILSPYHYFGCFDDIDYTQIRRNGQRYDIHDLERALVIPSRQIAVIAKWRELAENKITIAFCCSHEHAKRASASFNRAGIQSAAYISSTSTAERRELLQKLANGEIRILCAVDVLNEGADIPFVECLLFLRPTESKRIYYQQLGRGLRMYVGKTHCTVVDFIGNFKNAYKIVEYNSLMPFEQNEGPPDLREARSFKEVLNLPLNCRVHFDQKIIDVFASQALDPKNATRHSIGQILFYEFEKIHRDLGRMPTKTEVDRWSRLSSWFYIQVFGSWPKFEALYNAKGVSGARTKSRL
ncbi:MAG TPA: DEAD/DEAH box helicase family protein [Terracidiphilus sp.]|nr:DEAD/DEAH box helicase family protein [Terracidiphilus sp.]